MFHRNQKRWLASLVAFLMLTQGCWVLAESKTVPVNPAASQSPKTEQDRIQARAGQILSEMSLTDKVYQMFMITPEMLTGVDLATKAGSATQKALEKFPVGGIIYFAENLKTSDQTKEMISSTKSMAQKLGMPGLFIGVDEEGGNVSRVAKKLGTTKFPPMWDIGKTGEAKRAYAVGKTIANDIGKFGFNMDFAPVADVITNPENTEIGDRSFGSDASAVSQMVSQEVKGLQENGVVAALKHFPGHGNTKANSHYQTTTTDRTLDEMRGLELLPFKAGIEAGAEFVLVSHLTATRVDDSSPASMSKTIITDLLRNELEFGGVVVTDALRMAAISDHYTPEEVGVKTVKAGVDVLLMPKDFQRSAKAIIQAVKNGEIKEERIDQSVMRILTAKLRYDIAE